MTLINLEKMIFAVLRKGEKMDELSFTLSSPITEEEWDMIADVDFEHTESILFHTKHGKEVEFVKRQKGKWMQEYKEATTRYCSNCDFIVLEEEANNFCPNCGADMRE